MVVIPKTCLHTKMDGERCGGMALKDKPYCHFHARHYVPNAKPSDPDYEPPILEDTRSIIFGIRDIVKCFLADKVDQKKATTVLYAYQIAMSGVARRDGMAPDSLRELEQREAAQLAARLLAKPGSRKKKEGGEEQQEDRQERSGLAGFLARRLSEQSGIPHNLDREDIPPEERPTESEEFVRLLEAVRVKEPGEAENSTNVAQ